MQVAAILFGAVLAVATATALGILLVGKACGDWPVRFVTGAGALSFLVCLLAAGGLVYPATLRDSGCGGDCGLPAVESLVHRGSRSILAQHVS